MLRITSYNSGNQRGFRWWRYLKLFWTLLDFVYFENSEFSCHLRTVQLCYYVITDKTISVNSPSIFIRANSRLYREILSPRQTIKSLWKEISDWRSCLAVLIIKNIWLASIKVFPYPVHMTCADDRYLTRFTILIRLCSSTRRKASYHSSAEMHYFSIERKLSPSLPYTAALSY